MELRKLIINGKECGKAAIADRFFLRLRGMLCRDFSSFDALLIQPCSEIHTMFMAYPIDALFVSSEGVILKIVRHLRPWRLYAGMRKADFVIEFPAGKADEWKLRPGDIISTQKGGI